MNQLFPAIKGDASLKEVIQMQKRKKITGQNTIIKLQTGSESV